jgi:hypothetical protein
MKSDTTTKSTTPPEHDLVITALALLALAASALWLALRPLLAHGAALVLTAARWRPPSPVPAVQDEGPKPNPQPIKATSRTRRARRTVTAAA